MDNNLFSLWPHQELAVSQVERAWSEGIKSLIVQVPTGGGKSRIIRQITDNHAASKKVIYLTVHASALVEQLSEEITAAGIRHGIIKSGFPFLRYRVQVCSIQTLKNRLHLLSEPEIIIQDECHRSMAGSYLNVYNYWPRALRLGFTATPRRTDGKSLADLFDKIIPGPQTRDLIDGGYLADFDYYAPGNLDLSDVHHRGGEYVTSEVEAKVNRRTIIGDAIEHYRKYADHKPAIVCCVSIQHAMDVAEQYRDAGYKAMAVHSRMEPEAIKAAKNGLRSGELELLVQVDLLGEGVDIKGAVCLQMLRPTESLIVFLQQVGRVLRKSGDKRAIILDHVGNWERHGLPDDPRTWTLEPVKETETGLSKYKRCPECLHPVAKTARTCKHCGYEFGGTQNDTSEDRTPENKEGQLVDVRALRAMKELEHAAKSELIIRIRYEAHSLRDAVAMAKEAGVDHRAAWVIWTQIIGRSA